MASAGGKMLSAEERRRQKELEEARKAGLAAPELDEEGKPINPHIPQYMASAPWYLNSDHPSLKHQKNWKEGISSTDKSWYDRGTKVFQATKYRKGACENCGSMSHKTRECMERPRSKGARWTNKSIAADEKVEDITFNGFEAKRDRWNGYNTEEWTRQADKFEKIAQLRREVRQKELLEEKFEGNIDEGASIDDALAAEEDKVVEEELAGFTKLEKRVRSAGGAATGTVRNLRIREDTAKYLLNLDVDSAYYDPKSRSMREDPNPQKDPLEKTFAGDNFVRQSGANEGFQQLNLFSVTAFEKGQDVHLQATPSQAEVAFQAFKAKKESLTSKTKEDIDAKYGNAAEKLTEDVLALRGTEAYAEYDASGRLIRGLEVKPRSRYDEDIYPGNHTSVWGSYWKDGEWGYSCCKQTTKNAYCIGHAGEMAAEDAAAQLQSNMMKHAEKKERENEEGSQLETDDDDGHAAKTKLKEKSRLVGIAPGLPGVWGTDTNGADDLELDEEKVKEAMRKLDRDDAGASSDGGDRKRGYNSLNEDYNVSAEDMEAYRLKKSRGDDPLMEIERLKAMEKKKKEHGNGAYDYV